MTTIGLPNDKFFKFIKYGDCFTVDAYIGIYPKLLWSFDIDGEHTPLSFAVETGNVNMIKLLLHRGASINFCGKHHLLFLAISNNRLDILKILIESGSSVEQVDHLFHSPLRIAIDYMRPEIVEYLLKNGADVNSRCGDGNTPLHQASKLGSPWAIEILLQYHANLLIRNNDRRLPYQVSVSASCRKKLYTITEDYFNNCIDDIKIFLKLFKIHYEVTDKIINYLYPGGIR
jgi:ankyrin repeat protein